MTAHEFRQQHGDPATWTTADIESFEVFADIDQLPVACWFCGADNSANYSTCGFCNHHADDGPDPVRSADRLRQILAPAA